ncbi:hypothetical protein CC86DRAFT_384464 [Ophiobolus disseminans]|uniref:Heterokaryon incompatibility domain-containing protein n=1 Tax=Ophiobolus disseminans TaxID=1469910 RepID=A0A6A6ZT14_9PLEO|nr:hypothetical protein CC86DRAFT_384464 [Ophiobolus disseminans]
MWGPPSPTHEIHIEGAPLQTRKNLFNFTEERAGHNDYDFYWIDQICIDQRNLQERSSQVGMMSEIYQRATSTLIWLGSDSAPLKEAAQEFTQSKCIHALDTMLSDQYFKRVWIIQEILLARSIHVLVGGNYWISWFNMAEIVQAPEYIFRTRQRIMSIMSQASLIRHPEPAPRLLPLIDAIRCFHEHGCEDPRDKLYGLMGIIKENERLLVNYAKPKEEVILAKPWSSALEP